MAELIALVLIIRFAPLLATPDRLLASLPNWWSEPTTFFDAVFVVDALLVGAAWFLGHTLGSHVDQLHVQPGELAPERGSAEFDHWERSQAAFDHRGAQRQIGTLVIGGGAVVIVGVALVGVMARTGGLLIEAVIAAGLYFVVGLLLLGWAQVTLLDTLWRVDGLSVPAGLTRRWPGWLLLLIVVVALVALIAPRSYAVDPVSLIVWLISVILGIVQFLLFLIMLPFIFLASLLGLGGGAGGSPAPPPQLPPAMEREQGEFPFLATLRSLGFWLVTLGLAVYAVRTLYQSRWGAMRLLPRFALWGTLGRLWRALIDGLRDRAATLAAALRPGSDARTAIADALRRPPRAPRPTDPRGLIQFLYLSLVERAGRRGFPRRRGMTAAEYSRYLAVRLEAGAGIRSPGPSAADSQGVTSEATAQAPGAPNPALAELDVLTAAFLEARYSRHPVGDGEVSRARRALQQLLSFIRHRPKKRA